MADKVAYITVKSPFGTQETFLLTEMFRLKELGAEFVIFPRDASNELFHPGADKLLEHAEVIPLFNAKIASEFMRFIVAKFSLFSRLTIKITLGAKNAKIAAKNLAVLPKAIYLSKLFRERNISHLHAHWASTTSTMAYIINSVTGIPWSFTAHAWDIAENNLLSAKCRSASFVRAISEDGRNDIIDIVNDKTVADKLKVLHMGVVMPAIKRTAAASASEITLFCPANMVAKKGHEYLFLACRIMLDKGRKVRCLLAGDGPLEKRLRQLAHTLELENCVEFLGRLSHERLFDFYRKGEITSVVLPSITTEDNEKEGIPVALMEAMSYGIPVISTDTAGIPELLSEGGGILIPQRDPQALSNAVESLMLNYSDYMRMSMKGIEKIRKDFNVQRVAEELLVLFSGATAPHCRKLNKSTEENVECKISRARKRRNGKKSASCSVGGNSHT
jgi:colanic acid/amylovoran biosynthesis glycosyltransferase